MRYRVIGKVAHVHTDAVIGLDSNQYERRAHQLEPLGKGRYRVSGPRVSFKYGEFIDIVDAGADAGRSAVLEAVGRATSPPGVSDEMRAEADALKIRYGFGIGAKTLAARIAAVKDEMATAEAAASTASAKSRAEALAARKEAAKARR